MERKKILFVINNFDIGGPQKSLLSLLYRMDLNLYEVSLLILNGRGSLNEYLPEQVKIIEPNPLISYSLLPPKGFFKNTIKKMFSLDYSFALHAIPSVIKGLINKDMTKEKQRFWIKMKHSLPRLDMEFDVAIGVSGGHSMMYITDCVDSKKKIGWIRSDYRVLNRDHNIDKAYFKEMSEIISVSKICRDIFINIFPEALTKVKVMYNVLPFNMYKNIPADTSLIKNEPGVVKLLTICRLDPNKGLDLAIGALEILLGKNRNVKWYVLGDGSYKKELERIIQEKGLENHLLLLGFQINTAEFIKRADIIVHPSRFEGKSNVIDEAKFLLKPIVATNYETVNEQIENGETGLISEMNSESLAICVEKMINGKKLKEEIYIKLKKEQYDDTKSIRTFQDIIER